MLELIPTDHEEKACHSSVKNSDLSALNLLFVHMDMSHVCDRLIALQVVHSIIIYMVCSPRIQAVTVSWPNPLHIYVHKKSYQCFSQRGPEQDPEQKDTN